MSGWRSRSAALPRRSRSPAARCGWPTATSREVLQVDPGANKVVQPDRGRQRAAGAGRYSGRRLGGVGCRRARPADRPAQRPRHAVGPGRREPERDRRRRGSAVGGERGGGHGDAHRTARAAPSSRRSGRRQRTERRWRSARARCGSPTAMTARWRGSTPSDQRRSRAASASATTRPPWRWARAPSGWRVATTGQWHASIQTGRARRSGSRPGAGRRRSPSPAGRCGRPLTLPRLRTGAGPCACSSRAATTRPSRWTGCITSPTRMP